MEPKISVLHEPTSDEPFLVVHKPKNLPSAPLSVGDSSAYSQAEELFPSLGTVSGKKNVEHGLVHRIDTETDGLLLIAATQNFYEWISGVQASGGFIKRYRALCSLDFDRNDESFPRPPFLGIPGNFPAKISSMFRYFGPKNSCVRPVTEESSRIIKKKSSETLYTTTLESAEKKDGGVVVSCALARGFKHQVRCHLSWCGLPVIGDKKYSKTDAPDLHFSATSLSFPLEDGRFFQIDDPLSFI